MKANTWDPGIHESSQDALGPSKDIAEASLRDSQAYQLRLPKIKQRPGPQNRAQHEWPKQPVSPSQLSNHL